jgi:hypothetical protein
MILHVNGPASLDSEGCKLVTACPESGVELSGAPVVVHIQNVPINVLNKYFY